MASLHGFAQTTADSVTHTTDSSSAIKAQPVSGDNKPHVQPDLSKAPPATLPKVKAIKTPFQPNPKKAGMYSAILPGLGQAYNRQYWKIPVIYAGLTVAAYFFEDNLKNYQDYHNAYVGRLANPNATDKYTNLYTTANLKTLQDDYQKYLDLTVLFTGIGYMAQILDAVTFAYLKNFDMSGDISLHMAPVATQQGIGIGLIFNFK